VTSACITLLRLDRGCPRGRTRLALAFPMVIAADSLRSRRFSSAECATRPTGWPSAPGGGAEIGLDSGGRFALRPQVEYFGFRANGSTTNTVRVSVGMVLHISKK